LAEQRHLVDPLDHVLEHLADERPAARCTCARSWNLHSRDCALYTPGHERITATAAADAEATHWKRLGVMPPAPAEDPHDSPLHHEYQLGRNLDGAL
jgi:hypothetical protein